MKEVDIHPCKDGVPQIDHSFLNIIETVLESTNFLLRVSSSIRSHRQKSRRGTANGHVVTGVETPTRQTKYDTRDPPSDRGREHRNSTGGEKGAMSSSKSFEL